MWKQTHLHSTAEDNLPVNAVPKKKKKKEKKEKKPTLFYLAILDAGCCAADHGEK